VFVEFRAGILLDCLLESEWETESSSDRLDDRLLSLTPGTVMIETTATAESNIELAPGYRLLTLTLKEEVKIYAGQFAMLKPKASVEPLLRRALAVYRVYGPRRVSFLYQVLGRGTEALARVEPGGAVEVLLPLGNNWPDASRGNQRIMVVAGGIGSASVFMVCEELARSKADAQLLFGARNERAAVGCGLQDFRALRLPLTITTDDGSLGERDFVTGPLERLLSAGVHQNLMIYACGPWVMMRQVAKIAAQFEVPCLVSLEAPMGCGFGVCVGCVVAINTDGPAAYGSYKRVCTEGSIFPAETIRWEVNPMAH
jgi:dihydroorotate dehydrogenase electron transfer subunit